MITQSIWDTHRYLWGHCICIFLRFDDAGLVNYGFSCNSSMPAVYTNLMDPGVNSFVKVKVAISMLAWVLENCGCIYLLQRNCYGREYSLVRLLELIADFGVKTNAKLTPIFKSREKSKTGIQSCLYTATLTPTF